MKQKIRYKHKKTGELKTFFFKKDEEAFLKKPHNRIHFEKFPITITDAGIELYRKMDISTLRKEIKEKQRIQLLKTLIKEREYYHKNKERYKEAYRARKKNILT